MLKHAIIPSTIYNVNRHNNTFVLNEGGIETSIVLPVGNYTQNTFTTTLAFILTVLGAHTYTATVDPCTSRLTITNTTSTVFSRFHRVSECESSSRV